MAQKALTCNDHTKRTTKPAGHVGWSIGLTAAAVLSIAAITAAAQSTTPNPVPAASGAPATPVGNADAGKRLFVRDGCYECHGIEGQGANGSGPRLAPEPISLRALTNYLRKPAGVMPPYSARILSDQDAADIHAYLKARPVPVALDRIPTFKK